MEKLYILLLLTASFSLINCAPFSNTGNSTDEFENSYVGILISPIVSPEISREIEIYWSHTKIRPGDKIGLFFEKPRDDLKPIFIMEPTSPIGIAKTGIEADFIPSSNLTFTKQCLKYHVAWLRTGMVRKENCLKTEPTWMADMRCILGSQRMRDIFLPGTHDSSAYTKTDLLLPETLVTKYAITQDEDILGQLIYGARYLDIRVGYYATEEIQWWGSHGLVAVVPFQTVVEDVKTFLDNTDEIVIFDVQEFPVGFGKDFTTHRKLVAFLEEQFADYIIPKSFGWSSTLETIWSSGKRLIIGYDEQNVVGMYESLWPSVYQQWGNVQKVDDLYEYLNKIETNALSSLKVNPRSAMAELTPKAWDIFLDRLGGLRKMAEEVDAKITMWYNTKWQLSANIVSVDFIKATGIVEAALEWNIRRFNNTFPIECKEKN
ncbi:PI-PLC X domain-containing protein 1-like [Leptopilina heterotoma]|uniref:PI-PLC X domain-containing protein 1-like n=1 Tax=Leptopilina heterotoma TaxID=63436 RepID=UPI001CA8DB8E|nr:PI-PLC X domain-containing protein 1-like [Leptopilina heterotoma]XP_043466498.1 PI-PLC X domain-containing protein 1-like [Leptopilina heterotoma]